MPLRRLRARHLRRGVHAPADRGAVALETAFLVPVLLILLGVIIAAGRLTMAGNSVDAAAKAAAREASITRSTTDRETRARDAALASLRQSGLNCTSVNVELSFTPPGKNARVTATVSCTVNLSDAAVPGLPGTRTMRATVISPVDRYRDTATGPRQPPAPASSPARTEV